MKKKVNRVKYKKKEKRNENKKSTKKEKEINKNPNKKNILGHRCTLGPMAGGSAHFFSSSSFLKSNSSLKNSLLTERIKKAQ